MLWGFLKDCVPRGKTLRLVQVALTEPVPTGETGKPDGETEKPNGESEKPNGETEKSEKSEKAMEVENQNGEPEKPNGEPEKPNGETEKSMEVEKPNVKSEKPIGETEKPGVDSAKKADAPAVPGSEKGETLLTGVRIPRDKIEMLRSKLQGMKEALVSEGSVDWAG